MLGDYDGTVLLVSHDRDFIDRVATATVALEGGGRATVYPGGWSDYAAQRGVVQAERDARPHTTPAASPRPTQARAASPLTFTERKRLDDLPGQIARIEAEIAKLADLLADETLFSREPQKFRKASEMMAERQAALAAAEEEWLALEEKASA